MKPDPERRALNTIESELWTSDPEFYRQFGRAWEVAPGGRPVLPRRTRSYLWLWPVGLIGSGVVLCEFLVQSR
jgi:hypothetical protein